ncbi:hypothetical protein [Corynebacterium epidermidicanis]|uniref:2-polyprenylphenol hydroxylase-like oxidoreductase n=1 Tax=Corynebacterium epidermidicanis TaxID=1050174 RepID=A0A0G3GTQ0_9CORY|nr:hypothetical protein [Corynebacterium epidermidicanis]AKK02192.1 2-polyprenylphenol hydroxylase-like oxidoreductase [Corynebacterium epidermidicanis]
MSVVATLRAKSPAFRRDVLRDFFSQHPHMRLKFAANEDHAHTELVFALTYLLENPTDPELIRTLARDHIKVSPGQEVVADFFAILHRQIHRYCADLPYEEVRQADLKLQEIARHFVVEGAPATAQVVEVLRRSRRITVVRLMSEQDIVYHAGQFMAVSCELTQGYWRNLYPAMPSSGGMLEFHLFDDDEIVHSLSMARPGDIWTLGVPHGNLHVSGHNDVLMIAHATGLAPMRALILDMMTRPEPPRVHLFFGAEFPGELYDLRGLWELAAISPWLNVTPVTGLESDPWWVRASEHSQAPRGLHLQEVSSIAEAVTKWGAWADREVLVAGPGDMVPNTVAALIAAGTPEENIQF